MHQSEDIYTTAFEDYKKLGLDPLPIPYEDGHPTKGPKIAGWQIKADNGDYTKEDFSEPCNIGVLLGGKNHVTDIDCDSPEAVSVGSEIMGHLIEKTGKTMMFGRASKPRSHYIFSCDQSLPTEKVTDPADGQCIIEYRCVKQDESRGHQTVFPPSLRYDTRTKQVEKIRLEDDSSPGPASIAAGSLYQCFQVIAAVALLAKHFPVESERHTTILALGGIFARSGIPQEKAAMIVKLAYRHSKGYNHDGNKAEDDVNAVYKANAKESNTHLYGYPKLTEIMSKEVVDRALELLGIDRPEPNYNLTDAGNGRRLVDKHKDDIRFCVDDHDWYIWDGVRWRLDEVKTIRELAKGIASDIRQETDQMGTSATSAHQNALADHETRQRELLKWANQTENADRVSKTILSAESDPRITCFRQDFDRDLHLLNCANCVVDLYTGTMLPHDRKFMMSSLCPAEYDPTATNLVWEQSLAAFTRKHDDLLPFLRRVAGYSLQGDKTEERILLLYGPGNAGKGTFVDWLTNALGPDYSCAMDATSVLKQKRDSSAASGDIARLEGKRLVVVSEIEKGSRVQESFMKQASGNDSMVARSLYKSEREFRPTHQFWFQTNYRPAFDSTDSGNQRRYVEIPFDNILAQDPLVQFDATLKNRMRRAVLAWGVAGCIEWRREGLQIPESVKAATKELFGHNDFLRDFLSERSVAETGERVPAKELREAYERWCQDQGEEPAQGRTFNRMMEERGFERKQAKIHGISCKAWIGIRLKEHDELLSDVVNAGSPDDMDVPAANLRRFPARQTFRRFSAVKPKWVERIAHGNHGDDQAATVLHHRWLQSALSAFGASRVACNAWTITSGSQVRIPALDR